MCLVRINFGSVKMPKFSINYFQSINPIIKLQYNITQYKHKALNCTVLVAAIISFTFAFKRTAYKYLIFLSFRFIFHSFFLYPFRVALFVSSGMHYAIDMKICLHLLCACLCISCYVCEREYILGVWHV